MFVDGATYKNDVLRGGVAGQDASKGNPFPQGAVQEFRVITQNYKAEYQKAASAIITATTRSGGESCGKATRSRSASASRTSRAMRSRRHAATRGRTTSDCRLGGSLGGPIAKDKLFFFGTYELNARDEPEYVRFGGDSTSVPAALLNTFRPLPGQFTSQFREHLGVRQAHVGEVRSRARSTRA